MTVCSAVSLAVTFQTYINQLTKFMKIFNVFSPLTRLLILSFPPTAEPCPLSWYLYPETSENLSLFKALVSKVRPWCPSLEPTRYIQICKKSSPYLPWMTSVKPLTSASRLPGITMWILLPFPQGHLLTVMFVAFFAGEHPWTSALLAPSSPSLSTGTAYPDWEPCSRWESCVKQAHSSKSNFTGLHLLAT